MAQTQPRIAFSAVKPLAGLSLVAESFPEKASSTFKMGACVFTTVGYLTECGADPPLIMGIASRDGQNGGSDGTYSQTVYLAHPTNLFKGNLDNGSGNVASAATDRGKMYGIAKHSSSGKWYVDTTDVTNKRVVVWGFWDGAQDGAAGGIGDNLTAIYFAFDPAYFQGLKTS